MTKCLRPDCPNEVVQAGKKPKKYCSSNCKQIVWQRSKKVKDGAEISTEYKEGGLYLYQNGKLEFVDDGYTRSYGDTHKAYIENGKIIKTEVVPNPRNVTSTLPLNKEDERPRIGFDNICPISKEQCDDETCTPGAECNVSGSSIQKNYIPDETKSVISGVSKKGISSANIIPPIPVQEKGEDKFDFAARKNDWKRKYGSNH